jgi:energy-converting hydrogenase Eha subunit C
LVVWLIIGLVLAPVLVLTRADPDLWGHVRFGLDMLGQHTLPSVDPYSFTQDVPWTNHEWLSELLMGAAYQAGGPAGLALLKGALAAVILAIVLGPYTGANPIASGAVVILLAAGTGRQVATLRPQLWTLIGVAILCRLFISGPRRWWLVAMPLVFALWVNLHGGWIVGAGLLAVWTAVQIFRPQASRGFVVSVAVLSALATLINPYGWRMWMFLAETVRMSRSITEWQPLVTVPIAAWIPWVIVMIGVAAAVVSKSRPPIDRIAMIALLAYGSIRVVRLAPLCVAVVVILMSPTLVARWRADPRPVDPLTPSAARWLALSVVALAAISAAAMAKAAMCIPIEGPWVPDRVAGRALATANAHGKIVTWFDWGEYAIWHLSPSLRVSIDGRRETVYSDAVLSSHDAMNAATPDGIAYLQQLNPDYVWVPARLTGLRDWLATHGYRIDLQTPESFVAVRADQPVLPAQDGPVTACFPGP